MFAVCKHRGMTHLAAYLAQKNMTQAQLAEMVGVSRAYMSQLVKGPKTPSLAVASAIERATKGRVKASDWVQQ